MRTKAPVLFKVLSGCYGALALFAAAPTNAAISLADSPLFLTVSVAPNITVTLDDSGSMARAYVPDRCGATTNDCGTLDNRYMKSSYYNPLYYNPNVKYPAPKNANGSDRTTSFTAAYRNGFDPSGVMNPLTRNLSNSYRPTAFLDASGGVNTEGYMDHFTDDVSCDNGSLPRMCQVGTGSGSRGTLACVGTTDATRNTYCKTNAAADGFPGPGYYYNYNAANLGCPLNTPTDNRCYTLVRVNATSGPAKVDLNNDGVINAGDRDEQGNFANWYSFARTRNLATQTAAALAFVDLNPDVRVAWQALNSCRGSATSLVDTDCDGWKDNFTSVSNRINSFTGTHKSNFYDWIAQLPTSSTTPLPAAMQRVGEYYRTSGENSPYDNDFTANSSGELSCRRNYHVMMTDGIWNNAITVPGGNKDNATIAFPTPVDGIEQYTPRAPYRDAHSNTLADLAFHYWITDLRTTANGALANNLLRNDRAVTGTVTENFWNPRNDPASWQHMVNFTIGLGLTDYLAQKGLTWDPAGNMYGGSYPSIAAGLTPWPQPASDDPANVADLWHAAINSRGQFFSADDPTSLAVAFSTALTAITAGSGSSAALSANSTSLNGNTLVYQAKFEDDWSGDLIAFPVGKKGVVGSLVWKASEHIPPHTKRKMFTYSGEGGVTGLEFNACSSLSTTQQAALNKNTGGLTDNYCEQRVQWLRGSHDDEEAKTGGLRLFRNRNKTVMGDIINSDPAYVLDVDYGYTGLPTSVPGQGDYDKYRADNASRMPMVYVGSNDGHLYGIRGDQGSSDSGAEQFTYIPNGVFPRLTHLTSSSYSHRYYVDGSITVRDAYIGGSWRTVLLGGLNGGGKSIYALDVTDPTNFNEKRVLWEFNALNNSLAQADRDSMGYSFSRPQVGILENGTWVAIFGNGYNSTDDRAHLFIVDLATGEMLRKITVSTATSNGLSTPLLYDTDGNHMIDSVYAGDLRGNLWKIDVSGKNSGDWAVQNNRAMFRGAIGAAVQPITAQPKVAPHPLGGFYVVFGTGRYLVNSDVFDTTRQSFYGIWDKPGWTSTATRATLQVQSFDEHKQATETDFTVGVRSTTETTVDWVGGRRGWYLDLLNGTGTGAPQIGERVVQTPTIIRDRVVFNTVIPSTNPCTPGGKSWLLAMKLDGVGFPKTIFDLNNDDAFDSKDTLDPDGDNPQSLNGYLNDALGMSNTPVTIYDDVQPDILYLDRSGLSGLFDASAMCLRDDGCPPPNEGPVGVTRRSWIQIR